MDKTVLLLNLGYIVLDNSIVKMIGVLNSLRNNPSDCCVIYSGENSIITITILYNAMTPYVNNIINTNQTKTMKNTYFKQLPDFLL